MSAAAAGPAVYGRRAPAAFNGANRALFVSALVTTAMVTLMLVTTHRARGERVLQALTAAVPIGLGLYWRDREDNRRMSIALMTAGALAAVVTLAVSNASVPYS